MTCFICLLGLVLSASYSNMILITQDLESKWNRSYRFCFSFGIVYSSMLNIDYNFFNILSLSILNIIFILLLFLKQMIIKEILFGLYQYPFFKPYSVTNLLHSPIFLGFLLKFFLIIIRENVIFIVDPRGCISDLLLDCCLSDLHFRSKC